MKMNINNMNKVPQRRKEHKAIGAAIIALCIYNVADIFDNSGSSLWDNNNNHAGGYSSGGVVGRLRRALGSVADDPGMLLPWAQKNFVPVSEEPNPEEETALFWGKASFVFV